MGLSPKPRVSELRESVRIFDTRQVTDGRFLDSVALEHLGANMDLCLCFRYSSKSNPKEDVAPPWAPSPNQPNVMKLAEHGLLWAQLGNEVIGGAGRVETGTPGDKAWQRWLNRAYQFYGRDDGVKLISPGIATGNIQLLLSADARQPQRDRLSDLLELANHYALPLDLHLHNESYTDLTSTIELLQAHYCQRFGYYPEMLTTEWSYSHMPQRDRSFLPPLVQAGWDYMVERGFIAAAHTYRDAEDLPDVFKWANLGSNPEVADLYRQL